MQHTNFIEQLAQQNRKRTNMAELPMERLKNIRKQNMRDIFMNTAPAHHKRELICSRRGVDFIDDAHSCNLNSTWICLDYLSRPAVWITELKDEKSDLSSISDLVKDKIKGIVCLNANAEMFRKFFQSEDNHSPKIFEAPTMDEAVRVAFKMTIPGDVIVYSPSAGDSTDTNLPNQRGMAFHEVANRL